MFYPGVVSVSFRSLSPEEVIQAAVAAGLYHIEWGSDVHAPYGDIAQLEQIDRLQKQYGVTCCSYGTYFRLGETPIEELPGYIQAAKILGTDILRLWITWKCPWDYTQEEKQAFFDLCRQAAKMAEDAGVILCMECHKNTYVDTKDSALELMKAVNSPAFRMYWQANEDRTVEENVAYARLLKDYTYHIHVFQMRGRERFPLAAGIDDWKTYLGEFSKDCCVLLEFMYDGRVESLSGEADALRAIIKQWETEPR